MNKYKKLLLSILFDAIGYVSYLIPGIGELSDIIWAPLSAWIMTKLYKGTSGKVAAVINFAEEALPGFDFIPTFTLMWIYSNIFKGKSK
ncbi:hypothetical protein V8G69_12535 [Gaetbulibacter sp. M235]|uniref:hypothetical protein n=1 Tax=Gaetbulibacter sp. M235 TaxID=3126510 RepID=UPI00374FD478